MFVLAIVTVLFPSCFGQMQNAMWNGANGGNAGGMAGGTAGSGAWNMHGAGMGLGPPGGFGPVPPEYSAAMSGGFNTQPPPIPMNMLGVAGMGTGGGMMAAQTAMMGAHGMIGNGVMMPNGNGMMGPIGMMGGSGMMGGPGMMGGSPMMGGGMLGGMAKPGLTSGKKATQKPAVEYEAPEYTTKKPKHSNIWQQMKQGQAPVQGTGAAISAAGHGPMNLQQNQVHAMNHQQFQQKAIHHQQMQNQRQRQQQQQLQQQQQMQMQNAKQQQQKQYTPQQRLGIMAQFSNSMNQMMNTFTSIRTSLGKLITTLSKFVKMQ